MSDLYYVHWGIGKINGITFMQCSSIARATVSDHMDEITITRRNEQKSKDKETEEVKEQEQNQKLAAKRALYRREQSVRDWYA